MVDAIVSKDRSGVREHGKAVGNTTADTNVSENSLDLRAWQVMLGANPNPNHFIKGELLKY